MIKDVYLLRAFEAGSDAVIVLVCPEGQCRQVIGNLRAKKRVARVQKMLDEIGLDGRRLALFNIAPEDGDTIAKIIRDTLSGLAGLGPNPAS
jgi:coenzyme F420-reducing hydrogenase delta subunit